MERTKSPKAVFVALFITNCQQRHTLFTYSPTNLCRKPNNAISIYTSACSPVLNFDKRNLTALICVCDTRNERQFACALRPVRQRAAISSPVHRIEPTERRGTLPCHQTPAKCNGKKLIFIVLYLNVKYT